MNGLKNLWGEPVAFWAFVQTVLAMSNSFHWLSGIGIEGQSDMAAVYGVVAALAAVHLALFTHRTLLAPLIQVVQALVAFGVIYGTHINAEQTATVVSVLTALFGAAHWASTSPSANASLSLPGAAPANPPQHLNEGGYARPMPLLAASGMILVPLIILVLLT